MNPSQNTPKNKNPHSQNTLLLMLLLLPTLSNSFPKPPPLPILPLPTFNQLQWQQTEMALFLHFGPNTFNDSEWGTGQADPAIFNPESMDALQWARTASEAGFSRVVLTAKHHDGFCLWPSDLTDYSVRSSPWRGGAGDVVGELAEAAREVGIGLGLYLSPWDRHEPSYGKTREYNEFYVGQMTELLTRYGEIKEVWLDGAKGKGEKDMDYFFDCWFDLIHQLQPRAIIFSDGGPDARWVGDEAAVSRSTCWSLFNKSSALIGHTDDYYSGRGDPRGLDWVPPECDVSIRPGWFWHKSERPKNATTLLDIYYKSVGRNCQLLLNVPPNSSGLISEEDIQVLQEFANLRSIIFSTNLAENATVTASSKRGGINETRFDPSHVLRDGIYTYWAPEERQCYWTVYVDLGQPVTFNVLRVQEPIQMGQRIMEFHLDIQRGGGEWTMIANGTTIGYKRLLRFPKVECQFLRFVVGKARADPLIAFIGVYLDLFSTVKNETSRGSHSHFNRSQAIRFKMGNQSLKGGTRAAM